MTDARERLTRLIELAGESTPEKQRALGLELCDLLVDWPLRYPRAMREPFEVLLEKVFRKLERETRHAIADRLATHPETALGLLNAFYFDAPTKVRAHILARNAEADEPLPETGEAGDEAALIATARAGHDLAAVLGGFFGLPNTVAEHLAGESDVLAIACKGAHLRRATYSALALLVSQELKVNPGARQVQLSAYDAIPEAGAQRLLAFWRRPKDEPQQETDARAA